MVLNHVPQSPRFLVVAATLADANLFADGELHVVNRLPVPQPLENRVGKTEHQDVLNRFFPQVVIDPENLLLAGKSGEFAVERASRGEVVSKRFFDNNPLPTPGLRSSRTVQQACTIKPLHCQSKLAR